MIRPVGPTRTSFVDATRTKDAAKETGAVGSAKGEAAQAAQPQSAVDRMAAEGAPIDSARVAAVKAAIAEGRYPVDPQKIAEKMLDLDLPVRGQ